MQTMYDKEYLPATADHDSSGNHSATGEVQLLRGDGFA
jgi:hypothetical protein